MGRCGWKTDFMQLGAVFCTFSTIFLHTCPQLWRWANAVVINHSVSCSIEKTIIYNTTTYQFRRPYISDYIKTRNLSHQLFKNRRDDCLAVLFLTILLPKTLYLST